VVVVFGVGVRVVCCLVPAVVCCVCPVEVVRFCDVAGVGDGVGVGRGLGGLCVVCVCPCVVCDDEVEVEVRVLFGVGDGDGVGVGRAVVCRLLVIVVCLTDVLANAVTNMTLRNMRSRMAIVTPSTLLLPTLFISEQLPLSIASDLSAQAKIDPLIPLEFDARRLFTLGVPYIIFQDFSTHCLFELDDLHCAAKEEPEERIGIVVRWTPDGNALTCIDTRAGTSNLWRQPITSGTPRQSSSWQSEQIFSFGWSRDGKHLTAARGNRNDDIVLIRDSR
jgi:hypothetical protein